MARRSDRNTKRPNYLEMHNGVDLDQDVDDIFAPGEPDVDHNTLDDMLDQEEEELQQMELMLLQKQEEQKQAEANKRRVILEKLNKLQAIKERKALIQKALAGERSINEAPKKQTFAEMPIQELVDRNRGNNSEYDDMFHSIMQLKHGNIAPFANLMSQRQLTGNSKEHSEAFKDSVPLARRNLKFENRSQDNLDTTPSISVNALYALNSNANMSNVKSIVAETKPNAKGDTNAVKGNQPSVSKVDNEDEADSGEDENSKKKKKKSGILSKPDEVDIIKTVRFPHELLDDRHVKSNDKIFSKLSFAQFCAGEIEVIKRQGIEAEERAARLEILATICYHHEYLDISELKQQYGATMQRVERGAAAWSDKLADRLHADLAFRASVNNRQASEKTNKTTTPTSTPATKDKKVESKLPTEIKMHFCQDYNKGTCTFSDNHEGKIGNKEVTLFHLCRRCLLSENKFKRLHPETDVNCPSRR